MKKFVALAFSSFFLIPGCGSGTVHSTQSVKPPNVVIFLADDQGTADQLTDRRQNMYFAEGRLGQLEEASGDAAFNQRAMKQALKGASAAPAAALPGTAGGGGGFSGQSGFLDVDGAYKTTQSLRRSNEQTAYRRENLLIAANAADVDPEKQKDQIVEIQRFSPTYFELVRKNSPAENELLAMQGEREELLVRLQGKIYRIK